MDRSRVTSLSSGISIFERVGSFFCENSQSRTFWAMGWNGSIFTSETLLGNSLWAGAAAGPFSGWTGTGGCTGRCIGRWRGCLAMTCGTGSYTGKCAGRWIGTGGCADCGTSCWGCLAMIRGISSCTGRCVGCWISNGWRADCGTGSWRLVLADMQIVELAVEEVV